MNGQRLALLGIFALIALALVWQFWWLPPERVSRGFAAIAHAMPMLPAAILALSGRRTASFWGGCGALLMFCHGVMEAWAAPATRLAASLEIALALGVVMAASWKGLHHRFARRHKV